MYLFVIPRIIPDFGITSELFFRILVGVGGLVARPNARIHVVAQPRALGRFGPGLGVRRAPRVAHGKPHQDDPRMVRALYNTPFNGARII